MDTNAIELIFTSRDTATCRQNLHNYNMIFFQMRKSKKILSKSKLWAYNYLLWPYHHNKKLSNGFHLNGYI